jgi:hypothetical protein
MNGDDTNEPKNLIAAAIDAAEAIAVKEAVCRGAATTHAPRGEVFTCDSITPSAHGEYSGFIVVHQDEHGDMSAVPGHHYENLEDAEAAAALEAKRIGARYVIQR